MLSENTAHYLLNEGSTSSLCQGGPVEDEKTDKYWERLGDASYSPGAEDVRVKIPMGAGQSPTKGVSMERIFDA